MVEEKFVKSKLVVSGKRKSAIAKAVVTDGKGKITVNGKDYKNFNNFDRLKIEEPIRIGLNILGGFNFDVAIKVRGGGEKGQIDAIRVALSRAIVGFTKSEEVEKAFLSYDRNMLVADVRRKEACKPGDSKARAKRQTSYR